MPAPHPRMHGLSHAVGGPDPIPGLGGGGGSTAKEIVVYSLAGTIAVATGKLRYYPNATAGTIPIVFASVDTPPSPTGLTIVAKRISYLGVVSTIATVTITSGNNYNYAYPAAPNDAFAAGDYFKVDVTAVGSTQPGRDLVVQIEIVRAP